MTPRLNASIHIFKLCDIVFSCVGSDLDFDHEDRNFARVGASMSCTARNEDALPLICDKYFSVDGNLCCYHDPIL